jgi:predicted  nucleic acid-binding Zn-ribbon protein
MNNNLKHLIELQKIDSRLLDIADLRGDLPVKVEELTDQLAKVKEDFKDNEERINDITASIKKETNTIEDSTSKLEKLKDQLYLVKSNKEYDALNFEIDHLKESISESENVILDLEEEKENIDKKNESYKSDIDDATKDLGEKNTELELAMSKTQKEESDLNKNRIKIVDQIDNKFVSTYNRLRKTKDGLGIVNIMSNACGACYTQLPRQTVIEVKNSINIISCPNCSTYLFFDEELS